MIMDYLNFKHIFVVILYLLLFVLHVMILAYPSGSGGKMDKFYNKSDIVFLGGSFTNSGGHNPIEAAVANCTIITGPNVFNWQNLYDDMIEQKCCLMIKNPKDLEDSMIKLIENKNLLTNFKKNALSFSKSSFFDEDKLLSIINSKLEHNA